jgi:hypothetical protein
MDLYKDLNFSKVKHKDGIKVNIKDGPQRPMEDDLNILKVEYLSNH